MSKDPKSEQTDSDVFVPDEDMEGEVWTAKPLSLRNTVLLVRLFAEVIAKATLRADTVFDEDGNVTEDGVLSIISLLDPYLLRKLLSVITNVDEGIVEETYRLSKAIAVIIEFWENEEISQILGGAKRLATDQEFQERQKVG